MNKLREPNNNQHWLTISEIAKQAPCKTGVVKKALEKLGLVTIVPNSNGRDSLYPTAKGYKNLLGWIRYTRTGGAYPEIVVPNHMVRDELFVEIFRLQNNPSFPTADQGILKDGISSTLKETKTFAEKEPSDRVVWEGVKSVVKAINLESKTFLTPTELGQLIGMEGKKVNKRLIVQGLQRVAPTGSRSKFEAIWDQTKWPELETPFASVYKFNATTDAIRWHRDVAELLVWTELP